MSTEPRIKQDESSQESERFVPPETPDPVPVAEPQPGKPEAIDKDLVPEPEQRK